MVFPAEKTCFHCPMALSDTSPSVRARDSKHFPIASFFRILGRKACVRLETRFRYISPSSLRAQLPKLSEKRRNRTNRYGNTPRKIRGISDASKSAIGTNVSRENL